MNRPSAAVFLALLALPALAGAATRIVIGGPRVIASNVGPAGAYALRLQLYTFKDTRWSEDAIARALVEASRLLAQCGVVLARAELYTISAPRRYSFYSTPVSRMLLRDIEVRKPAVFFVEDTLNEPAFDAETIGLANARGRPELANTIWIAHGARDLAYALAHELVHVLADDGAHSDAPGNLMQPETGPANSTLTAGQCDAVRSRGAANRLLAPA